MDFYVWVVGGGITLCNMFRFVGDSRMAATADRSPAFHQDNVDSKENLQSVDTDAVSII